MLGEVAHSHGDLAFAVGNTEDLAEERLLVVFEIAAEGIGTEVSYLDHPSELAVNKEWRLYDVADLCPQSALAMEVLHELGVLLGYSLIVVVDQ